MILIKKKKLLYNTIENNPIFGKLNNVDFSLKDIFETEVERKDNENALKLFNLKDEDEDGNVKLNISFIQTFI